MSSNPAVPDRVLKWSEVYSITGLSDFTVRQMEKAGSFPRRIALSPRRMGWLQSEVMAFVASRAAERNDEAATQASASQRRPGRWASIADGIEAQCASK